MQFQADRSKYARFFLEKYDFFHICTTLHRKMNLKLHQNAIKQEITENAL